MHLFIGILIISICSFQASMLWMRVGSREAVNIKDQIFTATMKYDISFFDNSWGRRNSNLRESFDAIKNTQIQIFAGFIVTFVLIFVYSWKLGLIYCILIPLALGSIRNKICNSKICIYSKPHNNCTRSNIINENCQRIQC